VGADICCVFLGIEHFDKPGHNSPMSERDHQTLIEWLAIDRQIREVLAVAIEEGDDVVPAISAITNIAADMLAANAETADQLEQQLAFFARSVSNFAHDKFLARNEAAGAG
jgi:hypothetical protein